MRPLRDQYQSSLALLTDLYQLTMAYGYWKTGLAEREAVFNLFFRKSPFKGGYAVAAGLAYAMDLFEGWGFESSDLEFLSTLNGNNDKPLFEPAFLDYLGNLRFECDVDAVEEGSVVFPHEPLVRMKGPLLQCQILETPMLNMINFQTLIATKAARVCRAAEGDPVLEFGLRRAQGIDGALGAARAAFVGGCAATSNVLAGQLFGIPVRGTHAHSWVMAFDSEIESFRAYAGAMPNNCVFLVDTYNTLEGVVAAAKVGVSLREQGHEMVGVRLDSGDLTALSIGARRILDEAGFPNAAIVASNDLDEYAITECKARGAAIGIWGVGTRLVTAYQQPALGGVYKLAAMRESKDDAWQYKVKLSEQTIKVSNPGIQQVRRFSQDGKLSGDVIYDEQIGIKGACASIDPMDPSDRREFAEGSTYRDLLVPVFRAGASVYEIPSLAASRERAMREIEELPADVSRLDAPREYHVGLEEALYAVRGRLIDEARAE